jgi:excisionase family DNA binding protein
MNDVNVAKQEQENITAVAYDVEEVALLLKISYQTVMKLIKKGDIKAIRLGKQYRVPKSEIDKLLSVGG